MPGLAAPVVAAIIGGGASVGSSLLSRRGARTGTSETSHSSTSSVTLTPQQGALNAQLNETLGRNLANPYRSSAGILAGRNRAKSRLTRSAQKAGKTLETKLASRGFERSGSVQEGFEGIEGAKIDALSNLDVATLQQLDAAGRADEQIAIENALRFLPREVTQTSSGTGSGTQVNPGSALGAGFGAGAETLVSMLTIQRLLGGEGLFGGGGGGSDPGVTNLDSYFAGITG